MSKQRKFYTVIVGRPDYISDEPLDDTYMTFVKAFDVDEAAILARQEAYDVDNDQIDSSSSIDDYVIVAIMLGKQPDISV
jgi:hypothetical protein